MDEVPAMPCEVLHQRWCGILRGELVEVFEVNVVYSAVALGESRHQMWCFDFARVAAPVRALRSPAPEVVQDSARRAGCL